ncbi:GTPase domain-containing protein [Phycicoccus sp. KQZ13P-1]|uniref:GTPase domain-containing protein n=1 Tax=Phycicoccus mangrovi TaxID=2840470 RepID=UPI001C0078C5|nr:GTPase domain-containing protein [Phycicoccus mangrovi]MBT9254879.1 GTPase domain-containing protein [Phycicoccus mangrovi]
MTDLLFHAAPAAARDLAGRLNELLGTLPAGEASRLRGMLVVATHERPRMVLTGQYSSGKSTLIKALTDEAAEVVIDSAVATDSVNVFDWNGLVDLVDTPGVQAGLEEHDELAEEALRAADLVLFTVTVDLFDDRLVRHLRHVTEDLRKAPQLLVVITKCRSLVAADGVRSAAVHEALGAFADQVPWVECDAKTYLDGLHENESSRAVRRVEASRIAEVKDTINRIAQERGDLARFRVPLQQVALVAGEALAVLTDDEDEEAALTVLARQRGALTNRRGLLDSALERQGVEFRSACILAAERLADAAESIEDSPSPDWSKLDTASATLNDELNSANDRFIQGVRAVLDSQLADFTSEIREIEASPYAHQLQALDVHADVDAEYVPIDTDVLRRGAPKQRRVPAWAPKTAEHLKKFQQAWGAGDGVKQAAGSSGHQIVYNVGKQIGIKFKPYQAVRWANNIGKVARAGSVVLPVALEVYAVVAEERQEEAAAKEKMRRRNALIGGVLAQCDDITRATLNKVRAELEAEFGAALREIDEVNQAMRDSQAFRSDLQRDICQIQVEAETMLDRLATPGPN